MDLFTEIVDLLLQRVVLSNPPTYGPVICPFIENSAFRNLQEFGVALKEYLGFNYRDLAVL